MDPRHLIPLVFAAGVVLLAVVEVARALRARWKDVSGRPWLPDRGRVRRWERRLNRSTPTDAD